MANENIPRVSIEVQMGLLIFTEETIKIYSFIQGIRASVKNKGFPQKQVLVTRCAFKSTRVSSV